MSNEESITGQQSSRKLKLVLKTSPPATPIESTNTAHSTSKDGSSSPPRPSYSPVTPTGSYDHRAPVQEQKESQWIDKPPPPLPLNLEDNADAIALRATISLLQMQRQQSLKDIRQLDKIRDAALEDPRGFADDLQAGKLKKPSITDIDLDDIEFVDDQISNHTNEASKFGRLPNPQNIARCPPIEWSKYHIVGKPLDDMHDAQKRYPGCAENDRAGKRATYEHNVTGPYRPFTDKLSNQDKTKR